MISTDSFIFFEFHGVTTLTTTILSCRFNIQSLFQSNNAQIAHFTLLMLTDILVHGSNSNHNEGICDFSCELEALKCVLFGVVMRQLYDSRSSLRDNLKLRCNASSCLTCVCTCMYASSPSRVACQDPSSTSQTDATTPRAPEATFGWLLFGSSQGPNA